MRRILVVAVAALMLAGCSTGRSDTTERTDDSVSADAADVRADSSSSLATDAAGTTTTVRVPTREEVGAAIASTFTEHPDDLKNLLKRAPGLTAVHRVDFDQANHLVVIDLETTLGPPRRSDTIEYQQRLEDDRAWDLLTLLNPILWTQWAAQAPADTLPGLSMTLDGSFHYNCAGVLLAAIAAKDAGRAEFDASCVSKATP